MKPTKSQIKALLKDCQSKQGTFYAVIASKDILESICRELLHRRENDGMDHNRQSNGNPMREMPTHSQGNRRAHNQM